MKTFILSALTIVTGIVLIAYPKASEYISDRQQQELVREWQAAFETVDMKEQHVLPEEEDGLDTSTVEADHADDPENKPAAVREPMRLAENMVGMLYIDKIDLQLPILQGATEQNLKKAAASIDNTGTVGEVGNFAVAGHRSLTYGRNFNRLDELEVGDSIEVDNGSEAYTYVVTQKLYVEPHEVWVLDAEGTAKEITLVTCHPLKEATHRLIVKGKIVEELPNKTV